MSFRLIDRSFVLFFLASSLFFGHSCKRKQNSSTEEKEFRSQITQTIKKMDRLYKKTTRRLEKSKNLEAIVSVISEHLPKIHEISKTMLLLEVGYPKLFDKQEKNPPKYSQTLRNSIGKFSLVMTKLARKYKKNKSFLNSYQQVFGATKMKDQIVVDVYSSVVKSQKIEYQNMVAELRTWKVSSLSASFKEKIKKFLSSIKKNKEKQQRLYLKYPDIVKDQQEKRIRDVTAIKQVTSEIVTLLDALLKKEGGDELKKITGELKLVLAD